MSRAIDLPTTPRRESWSSPTKADRRAVARRKKKTAKRAKRRAT